MVIAALLLIVAPHVAVGRSLIAFDQLLNETFAEVSPSPDPSVTSPGSTGGSPSPGTSIATSPGTVPPRGDGTGTLPSLTVTTPWARPGEIPWGDDGKFDLLLLGSDAGTDRWSRRMDVMLLVEVDVATGRVAMFGFPRNMVNVPLPPGAARNASPCGCFQKLLNEVYTDATFYYPQLWPGEGSVSGIAAVRATISELTQRPIDAVLVADLWGVIKVVDAMGGIDMNVTEPIYDKNYPDPVLGSIQLRIGSGLQHFDGRLALAYARSRHQDSDYGRMRQAAGAPTGDSRSARRSNNSECSSTRFSREGVCVDRPAAQLAAESGGPLLARRNRAGAPLPLCAERLSGVSERSDYRENSQRDCERVPRRAVAITESIRCAINQP